MWQSLEPAIRAHRSSVHENFAKEFEDLHKQYQQWIRSPEGQNYRTAEQQAVTALFA
jgi:hypothetical protein